MWLVSYQQYVRTQGVGVALNGEMEQPANESFMPVVGMETFPSFAL
jgi:hypothetical protein